ncbi:MAG: hypothetical protein RIT03_1139 [Bacteroidota bacterium]|jgi:hypothetical protein
MKRFGTFVWLCCLLLLAWSGQAQQHFTGQIKDIVTLKPIGLATLVHGESQYSFADSYGFFEVVSADKSVLHIRAKGYQEQLITLHAGQKFYTILLAPQPYQVAANTSGTAIIQHVIRAKNQNNPFVKIPAFDCKAYNKLTITAHPDSIEGRVESVLKHNIFGKMVVKTDSSDYEFKKFISKQHLFLTEKVSAYQYAANRFKETILGYKMAGFNQPIYEFVSLQLQSYSIYDPYYVLLQTKYYSPISDKGSPHYQFDVLDQIRIQDRPVYVVYFKSKDKNNDLEGLLYIDEVTYAVAKAVTFVNKALQLRALHEYRYNASQNLWIPESQKFKISKGKKNENLSFLGETLVFDPLDGSMSQTRQKVASDFAYLLAETHFFDFNYKAGPPLRNSFIKIEMKRDAEAKPESFWEKYRKDSLDYRMPMTYLGLDSIGRKVKLEKRLRLARKLLVGYVPYGPVDVDLRYFLRYNNYEGFRFGMGGRTNESFSKIIQLNGYTGYGTKDGAFKYSLGTATRLGDFSNTWMGVSYTDDVQEIASTAFVIDKIPFRIYNPRPINISTFYNYNSWRAYIDTKIFPRTESVWQLTQSYIDPKFDYVYTVNGKAYKNYEMTTAVASIQWNPFSEYLQTPKGRLEIESGYPKFTFQFTRSMPEFDKNDFDFDKFDFRLEYEKQFLNNQLSSVLLETGYALGDVPLTHLYNTSPNNISKTKIMQRFTIAAKNSFETMFYNEFFSSKYATLQLKHSFQKLALSKSITPTLVLVTRTALGNMDKPAQHSGFVYKTLDKGYLESGVEINNIVGTLGLNFFYRYGANSLPDLEDNISVKFSFVLDLGL